MLTTFVHCNAKSDACKESLSESTHVFVVVVVVVVVVIPVRSGCCKKITLVSKKATRCSTEKE
jgi:hypothetical protein